MAEHLSKFYDHFNIIQTCLFPLNKKKMESFHFFRLYVSQEKEKFVTTVYRKPTFSGVYTHFKIFLPTVYGKFDMVYALASCCFKFCSDWTKFFSKKEYPLSFTDTCFKTIVDVVHKMSSFNNSCEENLIFVITIPWRNSIIYKLELS